MNYLAILSPDANQYVSLLQTHSLNKLTIVEGIHQATIILGQPDWIAAALPEANQLRWAQSTFAGVDVLCQPDMKRDYTLTGIKDIFGPLMSEYVFAYLLARERHLFETYAQQQKRQWGAPAYRSIAGLTLGIAGLGSIGQHIAKTGAHFGMRVLGLSRTATPVPCIERVFGMEQRDTFLRELDYLVLALPDTPLTQNFLDAKALAALPNSAVVINAGRGATIDESALNLALRENQLGGAVLDVFAQEPLPPDNPLWHAPNTWITPHNAAHSFPEQIVEIFVRNYHHFIASQPLEYVIDFEQGY